LTASNILYGGRRTSRPPLLYLVNSFSVLYNEYEKLFYYVFIKN